MLEEADRFLGECMRSYLASRRAPAFPSSPGVSDADFFERISFHGLALLLVQTDPELATWPGGLAQKVREQARLQTFWEATHREALEELLARLAALSIHPIIFKGTALAYSVYPDPALRRRGDTDVLIGKEERDAVRTTLKGMGFEPMPDTVALQETWTLNTTLGFSHSIDVHWRWKSSAAISECLDQALDRDGMQTASIGSQSVCIPDAIDAIILLSVNRFSHESFGYRACGARLKGNGRLIWAFDFDRLARSLTPQHWTSLCDRARRSSCARLVYDALSFAKDVAATPVPQDVFSALNERAGPIESYLFASTSLDRLKADLAASNNLSDRLELLKYRLLPSRRVLAQRYPDAQGWPLILLQTRRLASAFGRIVVRRA